MLLRKQLVTNFSWIFSANIIHALLQIGNIAILSRLLSPKVFGTMGILSMIIGMSKIISEFGFGAAIIQKKIIDEKDEQTVMFFSLVVALLISSIFFTFSDYIALYFNNKEIERPLKLISLVFIIDTFVVIQQAIAQKKMNFKFISKLQLLTHFIGNVLITIILAYLEFEIWALVFGYLLSSILTLIYFIKKYGFTYPRFHLNNFKLLLSFGSYFTIGRIANYFANQGDYFVVGKILGAESLGYYTRAYTMMATPANLLGGTLQKLLFPTFSKMQDELDQLKIYYLILLRIIAYTCIIPGLIIYYWSDLIVLIVLGKGWEEVVWPLKIFSLALFFKIGYKITTPLMNATGMVKIRAFTEILYFVFVLIGAYIGTWWGIKGVASGIFIALFINYIISNYFIIKKLNIKFLLFLTQFVNPIFVLLIVIGLLLEINIFMKISIVIFSFFILMLLYKNNIFNSEIIIIKKIIK